MKHLVNMLSILAMLGFSHTLWAYGGGGASGVKSCAKPKFSEFLPEVNAEVKAGAEFSFSASSNTNPESISVSVKEQPVKIQIEDKKGAAFKVSGHLPDSLKNTYARININAEAGNACKGTGGWLVKISQ